jgi:hypothetical protein
MPAGLWSDRCAACSPGRKSAGRYGTVRAQQTVSNERDAQRDFDFLVGSWKFHLKRSKRRLAGSTVWVGSDGSTVCRKVLDGRAEVEEMNVESADTQIHMQGLAPRLYNLQSRQWSIYWANAADGVLEQNPMVGRFSEGQGEFYNQHVSEAMPDSSGQASQQVRHASNSRFLPMGENMGDELYN